MLSEHLDLLLAAGRPTLTPDGLTAVASLTRPDVASDAYVGELWSVPVDGGDPRRLTNGPSDTAPAVSPDGTRVAFLRGSPGTPAQVHVVGLAGGEPVRLTDHPLGAGAPSWSPDGTRLAYSARVPEAGRYGAEDAKGAKREADAEAPRLITHPSYRQDDVGFTRDRRQHVFVLDVPPEPQAGAELPTLPLAPRQLTGGDADDTAVCWSHDGTSIAFVSSRHESAETDLRSAVHVVAADVSEPVEAPAVATGGDFAVSAARWLPDSRMVVAASPLGEQGDDFVGRGGQLFVTDTAVGDGEASLVELTGPEHDLEVGDAGDLVLTGTRVLVRELHRGAVRLLAVDTGNGEVEIVLDGELVASAHAATADGGRLVASVACPGRYGDLAVVDGDSPRWLTDLSARLRDTGLVTPAPLAAPTEDGHEVSGWLLLPDPATYGEGPHPVLLVIHGGPFTQYDWGVFDEAQVYAGAGYAVVMGNPRGSSGYGVEHGRSIRHAMGTVDADDVLALLDHALDTEQALDRDRVGVMGGSYGGYMTALLTTRTDRFAGAVVERGYLDATSFVGSSDIGWFFPGQYHGSPEAMREQSPMTYVDKVVTPTLVIHSERDWRCPVEQGQRWFTALRMRGVPAELLLFPGEGHELSRSGRPRHRQERFEHLLRWWGEHLPVAR